MAVEYATIWGYGIVSLILIVVGLNFEKDNPEHLPLRLLIIFVGVVVLLKVPSTLNHFVYANDGANAGILNSTQVTDLIRGNEKISTTIIILPYIMLVWMFIWFFFWYWPRNLGKAYKGHMDKIDKASGLKRYRIGDKFEPKSGSRWK